MKRILSLVLSTVLVLLIVALSGCSNPLNGKYDPSLSIGEQIKTRHYNHNAKDFGKDPTTSARPPVLINGKASPATINIDAIILSPFWQHR